MDHTRTSILVTGAAGFIGYHVALELLQQGCRVVGADNLSEYYDVDLKRARLKRLEQNRSFRFEKIDLAEEEAVTDLFRQGFDQVVHLAAQAGVRYSIDHPQPYAQSNLVAFLNILEGCRHNNIEHLVFASSSSVYGGNTNYPFSVRDRVDHPVSLYAATKKSNELMAHSYAHLYGLPVTGLRFFTVYGPWGRPDMAYHLFATAIYDGKPIDVFNHGDMKRDFTYIDDIVGGITAVLDRPPEAEEGPGNAHQTSAPYHVFNIGNGQPVSLLEFIEYIEEAIGKKAEKNWLPMQPGDMKVTYADVDALKDWVGYEPSVSVQEGVARFIDWYRRYYEAG